MAIQSKSGPAEQEEEEKHFAKKTKVKIILKTMKERNTRKLKNLKSKKGKKLKYKKC